MEKEVRDDILRILERTIEILKDREEKDVFELKGLSDHTIHDASIYQDIDSVEMATLVFALYKLFDRKMLVSDALYLRILQEFEDAYGALATGDFGTYNERITILFHLIKKVDASAPHYLEEVIDKARITKGSKLFEHGLSTKRAAEIMGITEWELMSYIGKTQVIDRRIPAGMPARKRIQVTMGLFGL